MLNFIRYMDYEFQEKTFYITQMTRYLLTKTLHHKPERRPLSMFFDELLKHIHIGKKSELSIHYYGFKIRIAYIFLSILDKYKSDTAQKTRDDEDVDDEKTDYLTLCYESILNELGDNDYISKSELTLLKEKVELYSEVVPYRVEYINKLNDYQRGYDLGKDVLAHIAYEEGDSRISPFVHNECCYNKMLEDIEREDYEDVYERGYDEYDFYDPYAKTGLVDAFGNNTLWYTACNQEALLKMPILERMKKYEIDDYKEFCSKYPMLVTTDEALNLKSKGLIDFETDWTVAFYNYRCFPEDIIPNGSGEDVGTESFGEEIPF